MARIRINSILRASTLVEVIIAMVILLSVFAIGMVIFAKLFRNSATVDHIRVQKELLQVRQHYLDGIITDRYHVMDSIGYHIEQEEIPAYPDRMKLKIYAEHFINQTYIDSLVCIIEKNNGLDNNY